MDKQSDAILHGPALLLLVALMLGLGGGHFAGRAHIRHEVRVVADEGTQALAAWVKDTWGAWIESQMPEEVNSWLDGGEPVGEVSVDELDEFFGIDEQPRQAEAEQLGGK